MTARQLLGLSRANHSARCAHIHLSGRRCGSPALAGRRLCYFHSRARRPARPNYDLPLLEDATAVQFALTQVVRALQDKALDTKTCALLLYALQTASANLKRVAEEEDAIGREVQAAAEPDPGLGEMLLHELALDPASLTQDPSPSEPALSVVEGADDSTAGEKGDSDAAREVLRGQGPSG